MASATSTKSSSTGSTSSGSRGASSATPAETRYASGLRTAPSRSARALGLTVIAVGVETDAERVEMRDAGCDYGQGNLFGPVRPAGAID